MRDADLFFRDEGSGRPTLLIHGLASHTQVFDDVIALAKDRRCIAIDLPRSGRSKAWAACNPAAIASELMPWLEKRGLTRFDVVGHSFGGLVAMELALLRPKAVSRLVIASAPALGLTAQVRRLVENPMSDRLIGFVSRLPAYRPAIRRYFQWLWGEPKRITDRHVDIYAKALAAEGVWEGMLEAGRAISAWRLPVDALLRTAIPTQVLWGEKDPLVPLVMGEHLATALKATFTVLEKTGHCVPEERPEAIIRALA